MNSIYFFFLNSSLICQSFQAKKILLEYYSFLHWMRLPICVILPKPAGFSWIYNGITREFDQKQMVQSFKLGFVALCLGMSVLVVKKWQEGGLLQVVLFVPVISEVIGWANLVLNH